MSLAEYLVTRRTPTSKPEWIADILERLCWILDERASSEILETLTLWLTTGDRERVAVALSLEEFYLKESPDALAEAYDDVCRRFPEFRSRCDEIVSGWRIQTGQPKKEESGRGE